MEGMWESVNVLELEGVEFLSVPRTHAEVEWDLWPCRRVRFSPQGLTFHDRTPLALRTPPH